MDRKRIGILIIGQTPRADLMAPLEHLKGTCDLLPVGALDGLDMNAISDAAGSYPLVTRMRDGTRITVDETFLMPLLQSAIDKLEQEGVIALLLLCAGPFEALTSTCLLLRPFQLAVGTLRNFGYIQVGIIVPTDDQVAPAARKWTQAGFQPVIWSMEKKPATLSLEHWVAQCASKHAAITALVFDYVGYPIDAVQRVQSATGLPAIDLGHLAVAMLDAMVLQASDTGNQAGE